MTDYDELVSARYSCREKTFEEVELPFNSLVNDHVSGRSLYRAMESDPVQESLAEEDYVVAPGFKQPDLQDSRGSEGLGYEVIAVREGDGENPGYESYISVEGVNSGQYSHLRLEVGARDEDALDEAVEDLEALEKSLNKYFVSNRFGTRPVAGAKTYFAD